ncbi:unnamed protein product [Zymoseptoria tritici ST99CH_3D1]|nr:unnamed protein product [Zymoseptoria tritici ST99CH_3D1]
MGCRPLTTCPKLCRGTPVLDDALMASYVPEVGGENRVLSPDTPYAAACAQNAIYFIDLRYDIGSARHIKQQLERLVSDDPKGHYYIDEVDAIAERRDADGKTVFAWNPAYARVLFADSMNEKNPS